MKNSVQQVTHISPILVFPATHIEGVQFIRAAKENNLSVVAATSEWDADVASEIGMLHILPYIYDPQFSDNFLKMVATHNICRIFCPVAAVYIWLNRFIENNALSLELIKGSPTERAMNSHRQLMEKVHAYRCFIDHCAGGICHLDDIQIAAVFRMASHIYGESNANKIAAIIAIFGSVPLGDIIEIGSLAGKSAAVLAVLARRYDIGNVLAIDSWQWESGRQHDSPETVSLHMADSWDFEVLTQMFAVNLFPIGMGSFNYLREESETGFYIYKKNRLIESEIFGKVKYKGEIALIHIDANHDYVKVKLDCDLWLPLLVPGGWLILDDYLWVHGNGPRQVGDALLQEYMAHIERAFVCGKALFVKFGV